MQTQQQAEATTIRMAQIEADPMTYLYGKEMGTAKLIRDRQSFRIFYKEIEASKSGKAQLVKLTVFMTDESLADTEEPYTYISGVTYLPNFVIESQDVYWILKQKIYNISWRHDMGIDSTYIPRGHKIYNPVIFSNQTPEVKAQDFKVDILDFNQKMAEQQKAEEQSS